MKNIKNQWGFDTSVSLITVHELDIISNSKGDVMHGLKASDQGYCGFGEVYFSTINFSVVKGWKRHTKMVCNLVAVRGSIRFVAYSEGDFFEIVLSRKSYKRITVPAGVWFAFQGVDQENILMNIASIEHDPLETESIEIDTIVYPW
ncbi:WxcM-like domain-containing protein [Alphaproteobacteria bacterium]|nr:WxcM-like domain-containing protein [Alphaproteobacteria bacterium]